MVSTSLFMVAAASAFALAAAPPPQIVELNAGESVQLTLDTGVRKTLKLVSVKEHTEPYYESVTGKPVDAVVKIDLVVEVDGKRSTVVGGPFRMPATANGLAILVSNSRGATGGVVSDPLGKDVRLEVASSADRWSALPDLAFPIRNYRWHANNYWHTYLGLAVNQARVYYHRGEDMGMIPDRDKTIAVAGGTVAQVPGPKGDGSSNGVLIDNESGVTLRYSHMNAPNIDPALQPGVNVKGGSALGLTGNTWRGKPVSDPHLHVDLRDTKTKMFRNGFPLHVAAYRATYPNEPIPIAGGWRHLYAGETIELDGSLSLPAKGRTFRSYKWVFTDGSKASGVTAKRRYDKPGAYSEQLIVTDDKGATESDFVEVFVLPREAKQPPPFIWMNYYPIRGITTATDVDFLTRFSYVKNVTIDFGDGTVVPHALNLKHRYTRKGTYVVTARGEDSGSGPATFHVRVVVE